ncbi:hypothetical protein LUX57_40635 [Actinomadura madurae]|uniref:WD40 repeat domain-containing protein n=1 Tax=Actinomadura madurae TaxID=1993 RepID=UPI0020D20FB5|nr:hypothetical protein [Actinomadura madurae]MCP9970704.1 hypothetical protein [Actinomadura madurae]
MATGDGRGRAAVWDVRRRERLWTPGDRFTRLQAVAVSPDGSLVAGTGGKELWLWDARSGALKARAPLRNAAALGALEFSADGTTLALSGTGVELLRVPSLEPAPSPPWTTPMDGLALHPKGTMVAGTGKDGTVRIWQTLSSTSPVSDAKAPPPTLKAGTGPVYDVAFSPDGALLAAAGADHVVHLWWTSGWRPAGTLKGHSDTIWHLAFRADGQVLATAGEDQRVLLWDVPARRPLTVLAGHSAAVHTVAFPRTGHRLASGSSDQTVALWDTGGWHVGGCTGTRPRAAADSSGGPAVAVDDPDGGAVHYRDVNGCHRLRMDGQIYGLARGGPSGHLIAAGGKNGRVRLFDLRHPEHKPFDLTVVNADGPCTVPPSAPTARWPRPGGYDNRIHLWTITAGGLTGRTERRASSTVRALAFSPGDQTLAIGADRVVELTRLDRTGPPRRLTALTAPVTALAYDATGDTLAIATEDGSITLWDLPTRTRKFTLAGQQGPVRALRFDPRGDRLAIVGELGTARWWTLSLPWALHHACQTRSLPGTEEWNRLLPDVNRSDIPHITPC